MDDELSCQHEKQWRKHGREKKCRSFDVNGLCASLWKMKTQIRNAIETGLGVETDTGNEPCVVSTCTSGD